MRVIFATIAAFLVFSFVAGSLILWADFLPLVFINWGVPATYYTDLWAVSALLFFGISGDSAYRAFKRVRPSNASLGAHGEDTTRWSSLRIALVTLFLIISLALSHSIKMRVDDKLCSEGFAATIPGYFCRY